MPENFEEKYEDVLHNIEFALVLGYRAHPEMTDWDAMEGMNALIRVYQAEARSKLPPVLKLKPLHQEIFEQVGKVCEWRLGRTELLDEDGQNPVPELTPKTLDEVVLCLKRIVRSIENWNKRGGRRGYYDFVSNYVG